VSTSPYDPVPGSREPVPGSGGAEAPAPGKPDYARIAELEKELGILRGDSAAAEPAAAAPDEDLDEDLEATATHDVYLADGRRIPHTGAIPTHYDDGDRVVPVLAVQERKS
jgi:hypothetical protein